MQNDEDIQSVLVDIEKKIRTIRQELGEDEPL